MKINADSWHWRVFLNWEKRKRRTTSFYRRPENLDLCRYFRTVMVYAPWRWFWQREGRFQPYLAVPILVVIGWFVGLMIACYDSWGALGLLVPPLGLLGVFLVILGLTYLLDKLAMWVADRDSRRDIYGETKEPGLVKSRLRARKEKVCPILELPDKS